MVQLKLELVFFGDLLNPLEFTEIIGIPATNYWHKGDPISSNDKVYRQETAWEYSTGFIKTYYLEEVTNLLLDKFEFHSNLISEYLKLKKIEAKLYVTAESESGNSPALFFDKKLIRFLSKIEGVIDVDLYFL
jgi:hypothetical protein